MFPTRQEVAENRVRKSCPVNRIYVPEDIRCSCLKCGGLARRYDGGTVETRECVECDFKWEVEKGILRYVPNSFNGYRWEEVPEGLLLVLWELEV